MSCRIPVMFARKSLPVDCGSGDRLFAATVVLASTDPMISVVGRYRPEAVGTAM